MACVHTHIPYQTYSILAVAAADDRSMQAIHELKLVKDFGFVRSTRTERGAILIEFTSRQMRDQAMEELRNNKEHIVVPLPLPKAAREVDCWSLVQRLGSTPWQWIHCLAAMYGSQFPMEVPKFSQFLSAQGLQQCTEAHFVEAMLRRPDIHPFETTVGRMILCCKCGIWGAIDNAVGCAPTKQRCRNIACTLTGCAMGHPLRVSNATPLPVPLQSGRNEKGVIGCGCIDHALSGMCDSDCGFCSQNWKFRHWEGEEHIPKPVFTPSPPHAKTEKETGKKRGAKKEVFVGQIPCPEAALNRGNKVAYDMTVLKQKAPAIEATLKEKFAEACPGADIKSVKLQLLQNRAHPFAFVQFTTHEGTDQALAAMGTIHIGGIYLIISPKFERKASKAQQASSSTAMRPEACTNVPTSSHASFHRHIR